MAKSVGDLFLSIKTIPTIFLTKLGIRTLQGLLKSKDQIFDDAERIKISFVTVLLGFKHSFLQLPIFYDPFFRQAFAECEFINNFLRNYFSEANMKGIGKLLVKDLKEQLTNRNVEFNSKLKKAELRAVSFSRLKFLKLINMYI